MTGHSHITFKALHTIWLAMVAGTAAYTMLIYGLLATDVIRMNGGLPPQIINAAGVISLVTCAASLLLRRKLLADVPTDGPPEERMGQYATACIVALAVAEGGAFFVIVLAIVSGIENWALAAGGAAVWVMLLQRPKRAEVGGSP